MSPILVVVCRKAWCAICEGMWEIYPDAPAEERCPVCGSLDWMWGPDSRESRMIRQGIMRSKKRLNPGATSLKRREHGRKQWRQFKPKPVESEQAQGED